MKTVSIIIPIYNIEDYLGECVDSVLSQSYVNLEVILVDDGSTDRSASIVDKYAKQDSRVSVIHKKNEGVSAARNTGLGIAKGKYVVFIDADDYITNDFIERVVKGTVDSGVSIITTPKAHVLNNTSGEDIEVVSSGDAVERMFYGSLEKSDNGVQLYDRKLLIKNKILFDETKKIGEDFDFFVRALMNTDKVAVDYATRYFYRPNPTSAMNQKVNEGLMASVSGFSSLGESLVDRWPNLRMAIDAKIFSDSVSLQIRSYHVRDEWMNDYKKLEYNTRSLKWSVLVNRRVRKKVRVVAFAYCILGNRFATTALRRIKK